MAQTFACPHCDASYRALPTLVGRKVRCSSCKNVFQLQHTGVAIKVEVGAATKKKQDKPSAPVSPKPQAPASQPAPAAKTASESGRPQTRAIRRKDERLKEMRNSLSSLAAQAAEGEEQVAGKQNSPALEAKTKSGPKPASSGSSKRKQANKSLRDSHMVQLTHAGEQEQKQRRVWLTAFAVCLVIGILFVTFWSSKTDVEKALDYFSETRGSGEERLRLFREKLWRPERLHTGDIPIIANINKGALSELQSYEWPKIAVFLDKTLGKKQEHSMFPIWVHEADNKKINELWALHSDKLNIVGFYSALKKEGVSFQHMADLPTKMLADGYPKWLTYALSLLVVPGLPDDVQASIFGDSLPLEIMIMSITGSDGYLLKEQNGFMEVQTTPQYEALVLGFLGLENASEQEWRVLDVRIGESMEYYFERSHNPLYLYAQAKESELLQAVRKEIERAAAEADPTTE